MYVEKGEQSREAICSPLLGGHQVQAKVGNLAFLADGSRLRLWTMGQDYSCGTAPDSHRSFPFQPYDGAPWPC
jgi:hypothetical protein